MTHPCRRREEKNSRDDDGSGKHAFKTNPSWLDTRRKNLPEGKEDREEDMQRRGG